MENAGLIESDDICDFLFKDENYPFARFMPELRNMDKATLLGLAQEIRKEMRLKVNYNYKITVDALAHHDMFKQISGNPTSITMIAAMLQNPLIKKANKNPLIDMYDRIKSHKNIVV